MKLSNIFNPFVERPNVYLKNQPAEKSQRQGILLQIIPANWVKFSLFLFLILLITPISTALLYGRNPEREELYSILLGSCFFLSLYTSLLGFFYVTFKIPYLQEIKNRLGYKED